MRRFFIIALLLETLLALSPAAVANDVKTVIKSLHDDSISVQEKLKRLEKAYVLAQEDGDNTGLITVILFESAWQYLRADNTPLYEHKRNLLLEHIDNNLSDEQHRIGRTLSQLLEVNAQRRQAENHATIQLGEKLIAQLKAQKLPAKSRLETGNLELTSSDLASLYNDVGIALFITGKYVDAHHYFRESLNIYTQLNYQNRIASLFGNLSAVSWSQNNFEKALEYTNRAINILKDTNDTKIYIRNLFNKSIYLFEMKRIDTAESVVNEVLAHPQIAKYPEVHARAQLTKSEIFITRDNEKEATRYLNLAKQISVSKNDARGINNVNEQLARLKMSKGHYDEALPLLQASVIFFEEREMKRDLAETFDTMATAYKAMKNFEKALHFQEKHYSLMIELQNQSRQKALAEFQEKFEAEQRENEIARLRNDNQLQSLQVASRNYFIIAFVVFASLVIVIIWVQLKSKQKLALQFEQLSLFDPLTKIGNRRYFVANIETTLAQAKRKNFKANHNQLGIFILDIDHFKKLNDNYGHDVGDKVLIEFAERLKHTMRESDLLVRWGGEEFVVVAKIEDSQDIQVVADKILVAINSEPFSHYDLPNLDVTCSVGGVLFPFFPATDEQPAWEWLINLADHALYSAKANGRNCSVILKNQSISTNQDIHSDTIPENLIESGKIRKLY